MTSAPPRFVRVRASIRLLGAAEGGRNTSLEGGVSYRPNHNFFDASNREMAMGFIDLPAGERWLPGETKEMELTFWTWPALESILTAGREWRVQEGPQLVGIGTVLEVLDSGAGG
ncbi:MAG TPA: hypothetical protein VGF50_13465 [Caulobacteraceae bacterium]|jgi:translation elongation factor EF-Tu-like GTPase